MVGLNLKNAERLRDTLELWCRDDLVFVVGPVRRDIIERLEFLLAKFRGGQVEPSLLPKVPVEPEESEEPVRLSQDAVDEAAGILRPTPLEDDNKWRDWPRRRAKPARNGRVVKKVIPPE